MGIPTARPLRAAWASSTWVPSSAAVPAVPAAAPSRTRYLQRPNPTLTTTAGIVNFHGGTIISKISTTSFNIGTTNFVWNEGANIDTNGVNVTASSVFLAPTGLGVLSIAPPTSPGAGYIAPPAVKISGGGAALGQGATANAVVDLVVGSPTYGQVTGFVITNPGSGYLVTDVLTVELLGGISNIAGESTAASGFTVNMNAGNVSGGLNKSGLGTLTLSGVNTYTGDTNVTAGILRANDATGLPAASFLNLSNAILENASAITLSRTVGASGAGKIKINNGGFAAGMVAFTVSLVPHPRFGHDPRMGNRHDRNLQTELQYRHQCRYLDERHSAQRRPDH